MYISHLLTVTNPNIVYNNIPNKENKKCKQNLFEGRRCLFMRFGSIFVRFGKKKFVLFTFWLWLSLAEAEMENSPRERRHQL